LANKCPRSTQVSSKLKDEEQSDYKTNDYKLSLNPNYSPDNTDRNVHAVETFARVSPKDMEELKEADKMSFKSTLRSLKEVKSRVK